MLMKPTPLQTIRNLGSLGARTDGLAGTVPFHQAYILLHGHQPPRSFPSRITSPLLVALRQRALRWSALVNVAWVPPNGVGSIPIFSEDVTHGTETYSLLAFSRDRARLQVLHKVADALREEILKRRSSEPTGKHSRIVVGEVGHVGGHRHAANVLVFPHGEWLGQLWPKDVPRVLDAITKQPSSMDLLCTPLLAHWRGRMGLTKTEQLERYLLSSRK
ncbi:hypothetical protein BC826DRAFT_1020753 [Russula brevipes]|nr:hypothetical protein BC826DRAFT_1020753 [Russula brevipes]